MVITEIAPEGVLLSDKHEVYITGSDGVKSSLSVYTALWQDGGSNWQCLPDALFREFDGIRYVPTGVKTYFAGFQTDEIVEVSVRVPGTESFRILPENCGIAYTQKEDAITFSLAQGQMVTVEADGDIFGSLAIFANPVTAFAPAGYENVIRFRKGLHTAENSEHIQLDAHGNPFVAGIRDNTYIFAEDGAVVRAALVISGAKNVRVDGTGVFSLLHRTYGYDTGFRVDGKLYCGFRNFALPSVYIKSGSENITVSGVSLISEFRGICVRNSNGIFIRNAKLFTASANGDGFNGVNTSHVEIRDSYIKSSDDAICMYTSYDSIPHLNDLGYSKPLVHISENYEVTGCHLATNARPFQFGGHASQCTSPRDRVGNIRVQDCEVLHIAFNLHEATDHGHRFYWSGIFRILSQSEQIVENITFENVNVNWTEGYGGKGIHIEVRNDRDASYSEKQGYSVNNVSFKNIAFRNCPESIMPSAILCKPVNMPEDYCIRNITLEGVSYNGAGLSLGDARLTLLGNCREIAVT